ncbi:MAG: EthD domain-containing protein [Salinisphaera sp.]|nr:EthD domain-containing protein [Salinisphaera sp.]
MIKLVYCVRRREDMAPEEFHRYWREEHGPKVKGVKDALRMRRYIQSHSCEPEMNAALVESRGLAPAYDGITEVWWDRIEDLQEAMASAEGAAAMDLLIEDESRFIDFKASRVFMTTEHTVFD